MATVALATGTFNQPLTPHNSRVKTEYELICLFGREFFGRFFASETDLGGTAPGLRGLMVSSEIYGIFFLSDMGQQCLL